MTPPDVAERIPTEQSGGSWVWTSNGQGRGLISSPGQALGLVARAPKEATEGSRGQSPCPSP